MSEERDYVADDAKRVMSVCGDVPRTKALAEWMDDLVRENVAIMAMLVEGPDENRKTRLCHLASQISTYRRIWDAANRALELAAGKPPAGGGTEPATGGVL